MEGAPTRTEDPSSARGIADEAAKVRSRLARSLAARSVFATLFTSHGSLHFELFPRRAPNAVANFVGLATGAQPYADHHTGERRTDPYFDGTRVHRIVRGLLLQSGCPTGEGDGGPGYTFNDEYAADLTFNRPYLLAMANEGKRADGAGTNGSQFFVTLSPAPHLNFAKPIFGELADDQSRRLLDELSVIPTDAQSRPLDPIVIHHVEIALDSWVEG
jgi:peptidyl-prolyl cis-trans isomerase A (cyclophilin A)